ncbi:MAG: TerB family tellurite resistance protein [Longimicrobiales bacterium]
MELKTYQRLALQHALHAIACDGKIHAREVEELRRLTTNTPYFDELDAEAELTSALDVLAKHGVVAITEALGRLATEDLTPRQRVKMLEVLLHVVDADDAAEPAECAYLQQTQAALGVSVEEVAKHFPSHFSLFMPGSTQSFRAGPGFTLPDMLPDASAFLTASA